MMKKRILLYVWMIVGNFIFTFMNVLFPYLYWKQNQRTEDAAFTKEACNLLNFQISDKDVLSMKDSEKEAVRQQGARKYGSNNT